MRRGTLTSVRLLTMAVGLAVSMAAVHADQAAPALTTTRTAGQTALVLNGSPFHSTTAKVSGQRAIPFGTGSVAVVWTETSKTQARPMYAISLNGQSFDLVTEVSYEIGITYAPFDPLRGTPAVPAPLAAQPDNELFIVQYHTQPLPAMQEAVTAAGGTIERYLPQLAQVVRMTPEARAQVQALPFVRWVGAYHPAYRMDADTLAAVMGAGDGGGAPSRYSIETMRSGPAQQAALGAFVTALGGQVNVQTPDQYRMEATLTPAQLLAVVRRNEVNFVDPWGGPGGTDMDIIRQMGGAVPTLSGAGMTGQGVRGEIFDTGVVPTHQQWNGQVPLTHVATNLDSHGNACYGINFATGTGNALATGMNPNREQGIFCFYSSVTQFGGGTSRLLANQQATDPLGQFRSCYQTSSVGSAQITTYTTVSAETDNYLFLADYLSCQSQSNLNSLSSRPQAWAKNIMAVGGVSCQNTLTKTDDAQSGASFGYASDGRMKPELAHSYNAEVLTTYSTSATGYGNFSGTSCATPITAGHFGLLHQMWHQGVWSGHGGGASVFASRPKSTTARALMIAGAFRYDWAAPSLVNGHINATLTRNRQGWGMADVGRLFTMASKTFVVDETEDLAPLGAKSYTINVAPGEQRLNITMAYADPQGNPSVQTQHRVNNVDLKVTDPAGTVYNGNWGLTLPTGGAAHTNWSVAGGSTDTKNTVENVNIFQPMAGAWTVQVNATEVVQDGNPETPAMDVDFALVVIGGVPGSGCYVDCNLSGTLTVADFGCFQTRFVQGDMYADCDGDGQLSAPDFGCFQTRFVNGCP